MTDNRRLIAYTIGFAALHASIAIATASTPFCYGLFGPFAVLGHHEIFYQYASRCLAGEVPYRDYLIEYPILGFAIMLLPRLVSTGYRGYVFVYCGQLLLFNAASVAIVARRLARTTGIESVRPGLVWYSLFFSALCPLLLGPFDLAPMAVGFAAADWWTSGHRVKGGIAAGIGVLMKVFPGMVAAPAMLSEALRFRESKGRGSIAFVVTTILGIAAWAVIGGPGMLRSIAYHADRGLQVESLYAGLIFLYGQVSGREVTWTLDHGAAHVSADWGSGVVPLVAPIQVALGLLVLWRYYRSGMVDGIRYSAAGVLVFLVSGKVLSPQFLIWLIPFVAVLDGPVGRRARPIFLLCCLMSSMSFPWGVLHFLLNRYFFAVILINLRNFALVYLLALLLFGPTQEMARTARLDRDG